MFKIFLIIYWGGETNALLWFKINKGVPMVVQWKRIRLGTMRLQVRSLALHRGLRIWCCLNCGVGHRCGSDPALLWLWCRPAAIALIRPIVWEPPYAASAVLKRKKKVIKNKVYKKNQSPFHSVLKLTSVRLQCSLIQLYQPHTNSNGNITQRSFSLVQVFLQTQF